MFSAASDLHQALVEKEPSDFVSHYIFEPVPYAFGADVTSWIKWKTILAGGLEVDPRDIVLTGSAAIGFSLNPNKSFKPFGNASDIDCGIISPHHFDIAWRHLRKLRPSWLSLPPSNRRAIEMHRKNLVFAGTIATDKILAILPFGPQWQAILDQMGKLDPTIGKEINLRIYKDYEALRQYQAANISKLRETFLEVPESEFEVPVENDG